jgi:hypothetical protein
MSAPASIEWRCLSTLSSNCRLTLKSSFVTPIYMFGNYPSFLRQSIDNEKCSDSRRRRREIKH